MNCPIYVLFTQKNFVWVLAFIFGLQNILKGMGVKKNPKNRQKTWRRTFWRSLCRLISHPKIVLSLTFGALSIRTDLLIFLCLQRSPLGCVLSAWDEAKRETGDALKLKMMGVGSPPLPPDPTYGLKSGRPTGAILMTPFYWLSGRWRCLWLGAGMD